jgi:hypothetical protein
MKKLITYNVMCLVVAIAFSSCMSNIAITKRHYNKGLYIDYSNNKETALINKGRAVQPKLQTTISTGQTQSEQNTKASNPVILSKVQSVVTIKSLEKAAYTPTVQPATKQLTANAMENIAVPVTQMKPYVSGVSNVTDGDEHHRRDTLSLFWLVILVVLILWLILFIVGGLGGFIDLLLLVAAVLLVLWLLRII